MSTVPADKRHLYATTFVIAVVWIVLDQASKEWSVRTLEGQVPRDLGPLILRVIRNPGAAFSLPIELPWLFVGVAFLVTYLVIRALPDTESPVLASAYGLVVGGAFGNGIDRIFRDGAVVDMLDLDFPPLTNFPVFNIADVGITVGAAMVAVLMIQQDRREAARSAVIEPLDEEARPADAGTPDGGVAPGASGGTATAAVPPPPGAPTSVSVDDPDETDEIDDADDTGDPDEIDVADDTDGSGDTDESDGTDDPDTPVVPPLT